MIGLVRKIVTAALLASCLLMATASTASAESPRHWMLELHAGPYWPQVDEGFKTATPYADIFGASTPVVLFGFHLDYQLWQDFGSIAVGVGARIGWVDGAARDTDGTTSATDETSLNMAPLTASVVYRWDWGSINHGVPLIPYFKAGLTYTLWWITDARDKVSASLDKGNNARQGWGGIWGFHVGGGLQIALDWMFEPMASELDAETGVNNSYIFIEYAFHSVNDFGSSTSLDLGDDTFSAGLMFEF